MRASDHRVGSREHRVESQTLAQRDASVTWAASGVRAVYTYARPGSYPIAVSVQDNPNINQIPYVGASCSVQAFGVVTIIAP